MSGTIKLGILAFVLAACATPSRPDPGAGTDHPPLRIEPVSATLMIDGGIAKHQSYRVIAHDKNGDTDVTGDTTLTLGNPVIGTLTDAEFESSTTTGGRTTIVAAWNGLSATSDLAVLMVHTIIDPTAPGDAPTQFGSAQPGGAPPTFAYPSTGVIVPTNMNKFEFDYVPGSGQNLFELQFLGATTAVNIYFACTQLAGGCMWTPTQQAWDAVAMDGRGAPPVSYTLRGLDANHVTGMSVEQTIQFTWDDLIAGIYYWAAAQGTVMRYDFGHPEIAPEHFLAVAQTTGRTCVGCHVLSRDGKLLAVGLDIPGPAVLEAYEVTNKGRKWTTSTGMIGLPSPNGGNFFTISPDNMKIASSPGTNLVVRSMTDGSGMTTVIQNATMPDWSPDGGRIAYVQSGQPAPGGNPGVKAGTIITCDAGSFQDAKILVPSAGDNNYYPSYSPDGNWLAFNRSSGDSYDAPDARVYMVSTSGGPAIPLTLASPTGGDSWPKWSPQVHTFYGGQIYWLTFSSRRPYGLHGGTNSQIWMVGIDSGRAAAGLDPSFAAFRLPFQDLNSGNHIAQWAETVVRPPCDPDCPIGEFCDHGECLPNPQ